MGAITLAPTPPKTDLGLGFWQGFSDTLATVASCLAETSNFTTANTVAELQTGITAVIAAISGVL